MLAHVRQSPSILEDEVSFDQLRRLNRHAWDDVQKHQLTLPCKAGGTLQINALDPGSALSYMLRDSVALQQVYKLALTRWPCSFHTPWEIVVNFDELSPGNKLHVENAGS